MAAETGQQQYVLAQRRGESDKATFLRIGHKICWNLVNFLS